MFLIGFVALLVIFLERFQASNSIVDVFQRNKILEPGTVNWSYIYIQIVSFIYLLNIISKYILKMLNASFALSIDSNVRS